MEIEIIFTIIGLFISAVVGGVFIGLFIFMLGTALASAIMYPYIWYKDRKYKKKNQ